VSELSSVPIKPIKAQVHDLGRYRNADTVSDLASMLLVEWPVQAKGDAFRHALAVCFDAMETQSGASRARKAFVAAAHEAGISVLPDDAPRH
jgi:hypothetical protein